MFKIYAAGKYVGLMSKAAIGLWLAENYKLSATKIAKFAAKFVEEAVEIHGDKYDYSQVVYAGQKTPVTIICPEHGAFQQTPYHHLSRKQGCPVCSGRRAKN